MNGENGTCEGPVLFFASHNKKLEIRAESVNFAVA